MARRLALAQNDFRLSMASRPAPYLQKVYGFIYIYIYITKQNATPLPLYRAMLRVRKSIPEGALYLGSCTRHADGAPILVPLPHALSWVLYDMLMQHQPDAAPILLPASPRIFLFFFAVLVRKRGLHGVRAGRLRLLVLWRLIADLRRLLRHERVGVLRKRRWRLCRG